MMDFVLSGEDMRKDSITIGPYFQGNGKLDNLTRTKVRGALALIGRNADPNGEFYRETAGIRGLTDNLFLAALEQRDYECILAVLNGQIVGLLGYQRHDGTKEASNGIRYKPGWHLFSWTTFPGFERRGIATDLLKHFFSALQEEAVVKEARLSAGDRAHALTDDNAKAAARLLEKAANDELGLPFGTRAFGTYGFVETFDRVPVAQDNAAVA